MRRTKSLVKQENVLTGLREDFNRLRQYEFFNEENREEVRNLSEAVIHSAINDEPRQAVIQAREFTRVIKYDNSLKAIDLLKARSINAKPFCFHLGADENFKVKSRIDWEIKGLPESDERIPVEFIRSITYLRQQGLKIDGIAIAAPVKHESIKDIAKDEFKKAGIGFAKVLSVILMPLFALTKDPILLIRIGPFYIEAGRWI